MQSLLQTEAWAEFKACFGWQPHHVGGVLVLEKPIKFGQTLLYAPEVTLPSNAAEAQKLVGELKAWAKNRPDAIFFKLEILNKSGECPINLAESGFSPSFEEIQPTWRQVVPLSGTPEEILLQMKEKGRYNTRLAEKKGVTVRFFDQPGEELEKARGEFQAIYSGTAKRQGFVARGEKYVKTILDILARDNMGGVGIASYQGQPVAGAVIGMHDGTASYLYGGSTDEHREVMAPYAMHYRLMLSAKERGCRFYDLLAIAAPGEPETKRNRRFQGITRFKQQFGGESVRIMGGFDLPLKPFLYSLYRLAEKSRRKFI